jgi:hypothetical protein
MPAAEQRDEADEGRLEPSCDMERGSRHGLAGSIVPWFWGAPFAAYPQCSADIGEWSEAVKHFERPATDFWITDLKSDLNIVAAHTRAGFAEVPAEVVRLRLFVLLDFLWSKDLLTHRLATSPEDVAPGLALRNHDLTEEGYYFLQRHLPRWQGRLYKHTTEAKERAFLPKWYAAFKMGSRRTRS